MTGALNNRKTWHGLPSSGRKRARGDMGQSAGLGISTTPKPEVSRVPPGQRSPRPAEQRK